MRRSSACSSGNASHEASSYDGALNFPEYPIGGGVDSVYHEWIAEAFRSIQPRAIAQGVIAEGDFDVDTLEQRLREEVRTGNSCIPAPAMIGAFTRLRA